MPKVYKSEGLLEAASMMIRSARILGLPIVVAEHVKKTFGETDPYIRQHLTEEKDFFIQKT